jgi:hypothetical protein
MHIIIENQVFYLYFDPYYDLSMNYLRLKLILRIRDQCYDLDENITTRKKLAISTPITAFCALKLS